MPKMALAAESRRLCLDKRSFYQEIKEFRYCRLLMVPKPLPEFEKKFAKMAVEGKLRGLPRPRFRFELTEIEWCRIYRGAIGVRSSDSSLSASMGLTR